MPLTKEEQLPQFHHGVTLKSGNMVIAKLPCIHATKISDNNAIWDVSDGSVKAAIIDACCLKWRCFG
jgi:hypothetical protein